MSCLMLCKFKLAVSLTYDKCAIRATPKEKSYLCYAVQEKCFVKWEYSTLNFTIKFINIELLGLVSNGLTRL